MSTAKGKRTAIAAGIGAFAILAGAALLLEDRIREEWLIRQLGSTDRETQILAAERLGEMRSARAGRRLAELIVEMEAAESTAAPEARGAADRLREAAARSLARIGGPAFPGVLAVLRDTLRREITSRGIDEVFRALAPEAPELILRALDDEEDKVRVTVAVNLPDLAPRIPGAVPALARALGDPSQAVRECAARALQEIGPSARPAVPALLVALADSTNLDFVAVFCEAALAAIGIGPESVPALAALIEKLDAGDRHRRLFEALGTAGDPGLAAIEERFPADPERFGACAGLARSGARSQEVEDFLRRALGSENPEDRREAAQAIAELGFRGDETFRAFRAILDKDPDEGVVESAVVAIDRSGRAGEVVPEIAKILGRRTRIPNLSGDGWIEENGTFVATVAPVLARLGPKAREAAPALVAALRDSLADDSIHDDKPLLAGGPSSRSAPEPWIPSSRP